MRSPSRALLPLTLATVLVGLLAPAALAATVTLPTESQVAKAETDAFTLTNKRRTDRGLKLLRLDPRLSALARERAVYMAKTGTFSHTQDGKSVFDMMTADKITWYGGGEIIAWNTAGDLSYSAAFAVQGWMDSAPHKAIMLSTGYNYVGFGLAVSPTTGKRYWAGVYMKGPDRTPGWVKVASAKSAPIDAKTTKVTVTVAGGDTPLQVLTAGMKWFQLERREVGTTSWTLLATQTSTTFGKVWPRGKSWELRVRIIDKAGNHSTWLGSTFKT